MLFFFLAAGLFSQNADTDARDEVRQRGSIPGELLRPRREESPRYPIDTVIGQMGQGQASPEAYECARKTAAALMAGTADAPVLSAVNKVFLESCINALDAVSPRLFRLGGGREEPDGAVSFLVRFIGRDQGITGEMFVRFQERRPPPKAPPPPADEETVSEGEDDPGGAEEEAAAQEAPAPAERVWYFEDLVLEEARGREEENREIRHRFDFPPYERFF